MGPPPQRSLHCAQGRESTPPTRWAVSFQGDLDVLEMMSRIGRLKKELKEVASRRKLVRQKRKENEIPTVAMVGYTNVGKTTLLNALTGAAAVAETALLRHWTLWPSV